jgi:hypothetical protein
LKIKEMHHSIAPQHHTLTREPVAIVIIDGLFETFADPILVVTGDQDHPQVVHAPPKQGRRPGSVEVGEFGSIDNVVDDRGYDGAGIGQNASKEKDAEETKGEDHGPGTLRRRGGIAVAYRRHNSEPAHWWRKGREERLS